jgi:hypothetical protein
MDHFEELLLRLRSTSPSKASKFLSLAGRGPLTPGDVERLAEALRGESCVTGLRLQGPSADSRARCRGARSLARIAPWRSRPGAAALCPCQRAS